MNFARKVETAAMGALTGTSVSDNRIQTLNPEVIPGPSQQHQRQGSLHSFMSDVGTALKPVFFNVAAEAGERAASFVDSTSKRLESGVEQRLDNEESRHPTASRIFKDTGSLLNETYNQQSGAGQVDRQELGTRNSQLRLSVPGRENITTFTPGIGVRPGNPTGTIGRDATGISSSVPSMQVEGNSRINIPPPILTANSGHEITGNVVGGGTTGVGIPIARTGAEVINGTIRERRHATASSGRPRSSKSGDSTVNLPTSHRDERYPTLNQNQIRLEEGLPNRASPIGNYSANTQREASGGRGGGVAVGDVGSGGEGHKKNKNRDTRNCVSYWIRHFFYFFSGQEHRHKKYRSEIVSYSYSKRGVFLSDICLG